jgi:two-component system sensor histidine kinase VanS
VISIRAKLTLAAIVMLAAFLALLLLSVQILLEPYYVLRTRAPFLAAYEGVARQSAAGIGAQREAVFRIGADTGYKLMIADRSGIVRLSSAPEFRDGSRLQVPKDQQEYLLAHLAELEEGRILYGALDRGPRGQAVVQLVGRLGGGDFLIVTQPLAQLRANSSVASRFFLIVGLGMLALGAAAVLLLSGLATRPILAITGIASAIARKDFSQRWSGRRRDELGILGGSINTIAERLSRAFSELETANEQLRHEMKIQKRFLASVSHDFKTPLGLIRGYAESLSQGLARTKRERDEQAGVIIREVDRLDGLVNDITLMMRMDSNTVTLEAHPVRVAALLREAAGRFRTAAERRGVRVRLEAPPKLVMEADGQRIIRVLDNLLSNALRHTPKGGAVVLRARAEAEGVRVEVENTGEAITPEHLPRLFEPFYRVDDARSKDRGGSGLGLAIVQGIVTAHGGACGIENVEGGVLAWFTLPSQNPHIPGPS